MPAPSRTRNRANSSLPTAGPRPGLRCGSRAHTFTPGSVRATPRSNAIWDKKSWALPCRSQRVSVGVRAPQTGNRPKRRQRLPASPNPRARPLQAARRALLQNGDLDGSAGRWGGASRMRQTEVRGRGCADLPQRIFSSSYEGHQQKNLIGELF